MSAKFWNNTGIQYDNNGYRTQVTGSGANSYTINNLNQCTSDAITDAMGYDGKGNLTSAGGWTYTYDAQNRLRTASNGAHTTLFHYDGKNRQIMRSIDGVVRICGNQ